VCLTHAHSHANGWGERRCVEPESCTHITDSRDANVLTVVQTWVVWLLAGCAIHKIGVHARRTNQRNDDVATRFWVVCLAIRWTSQTAPRVVSKQPAVLQGGKQAGYFCRENSGVNACCRFCFIRCFLCYILGTLHIRRFYICN
jgi:hypothetical protein